MIDFDHSTSSIQILSVFLSIVFSIPVFTGCASGKLYSKAPGQDSKKEKPVGKLKPSSWEAYNWEDIAVTPDGKQIFTANGATNAGDLWNASNGKHIRIFKHGEGGGQGVTSVDITSSGNKVLTASNTGSVKVWQIDRGRLLRTLDHSKQVYAAAFSPEGTHILSGGLDDQAQLWNISTGNSEAIFPHEYELKAVAFRADGKQFATAGGDGTVILWDRKNEENIRSFQTQTQDLRSMDFSPGGKYVATGSDHSQAALWNAKNGERIRTFQHNDSVRTVSFSPDGSQLLTCSWDNTAKLWDVSSGELIRIFQHKGNVHAGAFFPNGDRIVTAQGAFIGGGVFIWEINGNGKP